MTSGQIKFLTLLFALVNVWLLFHIPTVGEAALKFISVGQIPGTDKTLSPDTMMYLAIGCFVVSVVLIFWREFRKLFTRRKRTPAPVAPIPTPAAPVVRPQVFVATHTVASARAKTERRTSKVFTVVKSRVRKTYSRLVRSTKRAAARVRLLAVHFWCWLAPQAKRLWALLVRLAKATRLLVIDVWHWVEPHIRRFDRWLEMQLHRNPTAAGAITFGSKLSHRAGVQARKAGRLARAARDNARKAWRTTDE